MNVVNTDEVAEMLGCTAGNVRKLVFRGDLTPIRRDARPLHFNEADVWTYKLKRMEPDERERRATLAREWEQMLV